ncbi:hypothetical protein PYCC9005_005352 [Savitreella phatthalungensis]
MFAVLLWCLACALVDAAPVKRSALPTFNSFRNMFVFGDSYSSTWFSQLPGGNPTIRNRLGHPSWPGITSCYGPNWVDVVTLQSTNARLLTWDYAWEGAVTDSSVTPPYASTVHDLRQQISQDFAAVNSSAWDPQTSLFVTWTGQNDLQQAFTSALPLMSGQSPDQIREYFTNIANNILGSYLNQLQVLRSKGAQNFLVMSLSALENTPIVQNYIASVNASSGAAQAAFLQQGAVELVTGFNAGLQWVVSQFQQNNPSANIMLFDAYTPMVNVLNNPSSLGYTQTSGFCSAYASLRPGDTAPAASQCNGATPGQWFWLNTVHPTYPYHAYLAKQIVAALA